MSHPMKDYQEILNSNEGVIVVCDKPTAKKASAVLHVNLPVLDDISGKDCSTKILVEVPISKYGPERTQHELLKRSWFQLQKYLRHISKEIFGMPPSAIGIDLRNGILKKDAFDMPGYKGPLCSVHFVAPINKLKRKNGRNLFSGQSDNLIEAYNQAWTKMAEGMKLTV